MISPQLVDTVFVVWFYFSLLTYLLVLVYAEWKSDTHVWIEVLRCHDSLSLKLFWIVWWHQGELILAIAWLLRSLRSHAYVCMSVWLTVCLLYAYCITCACVFVCILMYWYPLPSPPLAVWCCIVQFMAVRSGYFHSSSPCSSCANYCDA